MVQPQPAALRRRRAPDRFVLSELLLLTSRVPVQCPLQFNLHPRLRVLFKDSAAVPGMLAHPGDHFGIPEDQSAAFELMQAER